MKSSKEKWCKGVRGGVMLVYKIGIIGRSRGDDGKLTYNTIFSYTVSFIN